MKHLPFLKSYKTIKVQVWCLMDILAVTFDTYLTTKIMFIWSWFTQGSHLMRTSQHSQVWSCNRIVLHKSTLTYEIVRVPCKEGFAHVLRAFLHKGLGTLKKKHWVFYQKTETSVPTPSLVCFGDYLYVSALQMYIC